MSPPYVAVVDDDDAYRELLAEALHRVCSLARVREFPRGMEAAAAVAQEGDAPDVLLLDYHMPGENALANLRALRAASQRARIVMMSSAATPAQQQQCLEQGAQAFLQKPARFEDLLRRLRELLPC